MFRVVVIVSVVLALCGAGTASAASGGVAQQSRLFQLKNANSGKCLETPDFSTENGARMQQWDCVGVASQKWYVEYLEPYDGVRTARLINAHSGKCLEVADFRTDNGAPVQQWDCVGVASQAWQVYTTCSPWCPECSPPHCPGYRYGYYLFNRHSSKVLEIEDSYQHNGALAQQWDFAAIATQIWVFS